MLNLAGIDLVTIRLVVAAAQAGSLTAAASEAHLALAAASRRLRDLEALAGMPLFVRHARGLVPTAAGRVVVKHGRALLQTIDQLDLELGDLRQGLLRHVRVASSTAAINQFLPPLLARHAVEHPQVRVDLEEQVSEQVVATLRAGQADIGIFVEGPDTTGLATRLFRRDQLVLVLPRSHRLARGRAPVLFADLLDEDWIGLNTGAAVLQNQQQAALAAGRPLRLRMQVRSFDASCNMVAAGVGLAVLPKAAARPIARALGLSMRPLADAWSHRRLLLATRIDAADAGVDALADFLIGPEPSRFAKARPRDRQ
jgi:DNA-binding transcriptional LysR family regulator